jgi:hypothetical protein
MSLDRTPPARDTTTAPRRRPRFSVPRGLLAGTLVAAALVWGPYVLIPRSSLLSAQIQTGIYLGLLLLTICSRRAKVLAVRILQRYTLNPLFRLLLTIGVNPFGLAILETRGRLSGKTRRVPSSCGWTAHRRERPPRPPGRRPRSRERRPWHTRGTSRTAARRFLSPAPAVCIVEGLADLTVPRGATSRKENRDAE